MTDKERQELWTTDDIARELGLSDAATARSWVRRMRSRGLLDAVDRDPVSDAKLYDPDAVRAAKDAMPGKGVGGGRPRKAEGASE